MAECKAVSKVILRLVQALLALVAFAASAYLQTQGYKWPNINFMVFTGVTGWLIAMLYTAVTCVEALQKVLMGIVEVVITAVWCIFWMAAAASFAAYAPCKSPTQLDTENPFSGCNAFLASQAFAWMSLLLWIASLAIAVVDTRRGEGITGRRTF